MERGDQLRVVSSLIFLAVGLYLALSDGQELDAPSFCKEHPPLVSFRVADRMLGLKKTFNFSDDFQSLSSRSFELVASDAMFNQESLQREVRNAMQSSTRELSLVLGPTNVGKSKVIKNECSTAELPCIYIDGRGHSNFVEALVDGLQNAVPMQKVRGASGFINDAFKGAFEPPVHEKTYTYVGVNLQKWIGDFFHTFRETVWGEVRRDGDSTNAANTFIRHALSTRTGSSSLLQSTSAGQLLDKLVGRVGPFTLLLDEADIILSDTTNAGALRQLVRLTKQEKQINAVLVSSEGAFPYDLEKHEGFRRAHLTSRLYASAPSAGEVEKLLQSWSMSADLARALTAYYGGHLYTIHTALRKAAHTTTFSIDAVEDVTDAQEKARTVMVDTAQETAITQRNMKFILVKLASQGWADVDRRDAAAKRLVADHIAFLLLKPFTGYEFTTEVAHAAMLYDALLVPSSRMMQIALADELCSVAWATRLRSADNIA